MSEAKCTVRTNGMQSFGVSSPGLVPAQRGLRGHARIAFVTFTDEEHDAGRLVFQCEEQIPNTSCWARTEQVMGTELDLDIVHVRAERTNMPAMQYVEAAIANFRPCFILTCGTAGGITGRDGLNLGDLVVGDFIEYYEFAKVSTPKQATDSARWRFWRRHKRPEPVVQPRYVPFDHPAAFLRQVPAQYVRDKTNWTERIREPRPSSSSAAPRVVTGMILTGEKILQADETEYQRALLRRYDKALAVEMESYGIASAVYRARSDKQSAFRYHYNPLFLAIRGISDFVDAESHVAQQHRGRWTPYAAQAACAFALAMSERLLATLER